MNNILKKTHKNSFFRQAQKGSIVWSELFTDNPAIEDHSGLERKRDVVILQMMEITDDRIIFELVWRDEYEDEPIDRNAVIDECIDTIKEGHTMYDDTIYQIVRKLEGLKK